MRSARTQPGAEKPQQELRFTVRDPMLDEGLIGLEAYDENHGRFLPDKLFLFAMKRIRVDTSDYFDGHSQNESQFQQYRKAVEDTVSNSGTREFQLEPWLKPLYSGGPGGKLAGVGLRITLNPSYSNVLLAPPFLGMRPYVGMSPEQREAVASANEVLSVARAARFLPVRYEIGKTVDEPAKALARLERVLELGVTATQLRIVPSYPTSARQQDLYPSIPPVERTHDRISQALFLRESRIEEEGIPTEPIEIIPDIDPPVQHVS